MYLQTRYAGIEERQCHQLFPETTYNRRFIIRFKFNDRTFRSNYHRHFHCFVRMRLEQQGNKRERSERCAIIAHTRSLVDPRTMKFESGNDRSSSVDPSSLDLLYDTCFILLRSSRNLQYRAIYLLQVPQPGQIHNIPIPYRPHDFWFVYVQETHARPSSLLCPDVFRFFYFAPLRWTRHKHGLSSSLSLLAYHLNNAND